MNRHIAASTLPSSKISENQKSDRHCGKAARIVIHLSQPLGRFTAVHGGGL